jgi:hypothetical protein
MNMTRTKNITLTYNNIETLANAQLALAAQLEATKAALADSQRLLDQLRSAKGTEEIVPPHNALFDQIEGLLRARPMILQDIIKTTGAETNKVKVVLLKMQREQIGIVNLGNQFRALWFIPDTEAVAKLVRLAK